DESGEYALHVADQSGSKTVKKINLGNPPSYFYTPLWSPDSKKIAYTDKRLNLWYVDVDGRTPVKVTTYRYDDPTSGFGQTWSPDSKWLTYAKLLENHLRTIFVYSLESGKESQITDGISDARYPVFDKGGKSLFFAVSTDVGLSAGWLDLSSFQHPVLRSVYAAVLKKGDPSTVEPQSDEEKAAEEKKDSAGGDKGKEADKNKAGDKAKDGDKSKEGEKGKEGEKKEEAVKVTTDLDGIGQRIVSLPIKPANYVGLDAGKAGTLFLSEIADVPTFEPQTPATVSKFDLTTRKTEPFLSGINGLGVSANGEKVLYRQGQGWFIAKTDAAPKPGDGALKLDEMEVYVDPRAEWNQMYHEVWRIQRDFLYDPHHYGLDINAAEKKYAPYLKGLAGRPDLNYLFDEMLREVTVVPLPSEFPLRNRAWEEDNRRRVDELSGGKLAYVHVPDTAVDGYLNFNRFYFAQVGKQGAVIDERYNHGGEVADYIIDMLKRPLRNCAISREGEAFCSPLAQIYGPKTMIINEMSGSGRDAPPWMFKQDQVGPLVGTRTWGGLVGIYGYPPLLDGGYVTAPRVAIYGLKGEWEVENHGIAPDIEVENDPASVAAGHDRQLEKAVEVTLEALKKSPVTIPEHPPYPNYHKK